MSNYDASVLTAEKQTSDYFNETINSDPELKNHAKIVVNWITSELFSLLKKNNQDLNNSPVSPENLGQLIKLISTNEISGKIAKDVLEDMFSSGKTARQIVDEKGLQQVTDQGEIAKVIDEVIAENPKMVEQYLAGKDKLLGFFVGQAMKLTKGKANPKMLNDILKQNPDLMKQFASAAANTMGENNPGFGNFMGDMVNDKFKKQPPRSQPNMGRSPPPPSSMNMGPSMSSGPMNTQNVNQRQDMKGPANLDNILNQLN